MFGPDPGDRACVSESATCWCSPRRRERVVVRTGSLRATVPWAPRRGQRGGDGDPADHGAAGVAAPAGEEGFTPARPNCTAMSSIDLSQAADMPVLARSSACLSPRFRRKQWRCPGYDPGTLRSTTPIGASGQRGANGRRVGRLVRRESRRDLVTSWGWRRRWPATASASPELRRSPDGACRCTARSHAPSPRSRFRYLGAAVGAAAGLLDQSHRRKVVRDQPRNRQNRTGAEL